MVVLALVIEPLRRLHLYYMANSDADPQVKVDQWPAIIQLLNERSSIVYACLQYYATMLSDPCRCTRLHLAARQRGCSTIADWLQRYSADWNLLRKCVLGVYSALHRRQYNYLRSQFGVFRLADTRLSQLTRDAEAATLARTPPCCLPAGITRGIVRNAWSYAQKADPTATWKAAQGALLFCSYTLYLIGLF